MLWKTDYEGMARDLMQMFVNEEYKAFPVALHEDMMDTISRITDPEMNIAWPRPVEVEDRYVRRRDRRRAASTWAA